MAWRTLPLAWQFSRSSCLAGLQHRMQMLGDEHRCRLADAIRKLDRGPAVVDAESASRQRRFVHPCVEIGETLAELDFVAVNRNRPKRRLDPGLRRERQIAGVAREEPADARAFELQISGKPAWIAQVYFASDDATEQPDQEVEEVDSDVRHQTARPFLGSLPRHVVPA